MTTLSRMLAICAALALMLAVPLLAEEPPKKSEEKASQSSEKQAPGKDGSSAKDSSREPAAKPASAREAQAKVEKAKEGNDEPVVFTNGDLEALFGKPEPSAPPATAAPLPAAVPAREKPGASAQEVRTEQRIQQIQEEIARLNEMNRSLRNPLLRRVPQTDDEKKAFKGKGSDERIRINNERIAVLGAELARLQSPGTSASPAPKR